MSYSPDNIFQKIIEGKIPSFKILETEHCLAILDAFPAVPGHSLLISKHPVCTMEELTEEQAAGIMKELPKLARTVKKATGATGVNILQNGGAHAGQAVFHLHIHVIPRFASDSQPIKFAAGAKQLSPESGEAMLGKFLSAM